MMIPDLADADFISVEDELIINFLDADHLSRLEQLRINFEQVMDESISLQQALYAAIDGVYTVIFDEECEDDVTWIVVDPDTGNVM